MFKRMIKKPKTRSEIKISHDNNFDFDLLTSESSDTNIENAIRAKAYELWEHDGRPEGQSEYFWFKAIEELQGNDEKQMCV